MALWARELLRDTYELAVVMLLSMLVVAVSAWGLRTVGNVFIPELANGAELRHTDASFIVAKSGVNKASYNKPPRIQVGLFEKERGKDLKVTSPKPYALYTADGTKIREFDRHAWLNLRVGTKGKYKAWRGSWEYVSDDPLYVEALSGTKRIELPRYENRPGWNLDLNDNVFRGRITLAQDDSGDPWVVNDLRMEAYVKGVAETSNNNDADFLKSMSVAERTYALFQVQVPTKYSAHPFILTATANDQIYKGYNYEVRSPNVAAAVNATRGQVGTYGGEVVVTPYFSHSDGRTRAWSEVWNGSRDWLLSVNDPCCTNMSLSGHGVGMSGEGARYYAERGKTWEWILKHYYTDITLTSKWQ